MRRFSLLARGLSKKVQNIHHVEALHFTHYNFS